LGNILGDYFTKISGHPDYSLRFPETPLSLTATALLTGVPVTTVATAQSSHSHAWVILA
jgi:hypothetical protein